jgi:hypothetical protein
MGSCADAHAHKGFGDAYRVLLYSVNVSFLLAFYSTAFSMFTSFCWENIPLFIKADLKQN